MAVLDLLALLMSLTAIFAWINHRYLKLPTGPDRALLLTVSCCVVVFSTLLQGLTIGRVVGALSHGG
jgi:NhaP-type Na+/H+ or K+/H+ antiporter